jgi:hypothetical protein
MLMLVSGDHQLARLMENARGMVKYINSLKESAMRVLTNSFSAC